LRIYVVTDSEDCFFKDIQFVKIGFCTSRDIKARISQLQTGNPRTIRLVALFDIGGSENVLRGCEKLLHWKLRGYCVSGEWFVFGTEVLDTLKAFSQLSKVWWFFYGEDRLDRAGIIYPEIFCEPEKTEPSSQSKGVD
jgi:hypothetical protein